MMHAHVVHFIPELIQFPHIWLSVHIEQVTNDDGKEEWWLVKRLESATMKNWFFHLHSFLLPEEKPFWKKDKVLRNPFWESATLVKAKSRSCDIIFSWTLPFMEFSSLMSQLNLIKILTWTSVVQICNISDDRGSISFRGNRNAKSKTKSWNSGFFWDGSMNCENERRILKHKSPVSPLQDVFLYHKNWLSNVNIVREIWSNINIGWQIYSSYTLLSDNKFLWTQWKIRWAALNCMSMSGATVALGRVKRQKSRCRRKEWCKNNRSSVS